MKHFSNIKDLMNFLRNAQCDTRVRFGQIFQNDKLVATYNIKSNHKTQCIRSFNYNDIYKIGETINFCGYKITFENKKDGCNECVFQDKKTHQCIFPSLSPCLKCESKSILKMFNKH